MKLQLKNQASIPVIGAWQEVKTGNKYFITQKLGESIQICYTLQGDNAQWGGYRSGTPNMLLAPEGTEYKGWRRKCCYRLTKAEIEFHLQKVYNWVAPC